jgi:ketosteroid isomerase-like protein
VDLLQRVDRLESLEEIRSVKASYAKACDAPYDADAIASLFTEDAVWDGDIFGRYDGREAIRDHFKTSSERMYWQNTYVICPDIELRPGEDFATGTWYLWEPCTLPAGDQPEGKEAALLAGKYRDEYRRVNGRWYFSRVEFRPSFLTSLAKGWVRQQFR